MEASAFAVILGELVARVPGAYAAGLVDVDGETVDYAGHGEPFDLKVAAAHLRIILLELARLTPLGEPRWLVIRGAKRSIVARTLEDGYALTLLLRRRAGFAASKRAFSACAHALAAEAGWTSAAARGVRVVAWNAVHVTTDAAGRPAIVTAGSARVAVEVLGAVVGLSRGERGYRVRTSHGGELTLVREPGEHWYADADVDERAHAASGAPSSKGAPRSKGGGESGPPHRWRRGK